MARLLIVCVSDKFFLSHFYDRAKVLADSGYSVTVAAPDSGYAGEIVSKGLSYVSIPMERHSINPLKEWIFIRNLSKLYSQQRPEIVWHIGIKPIVLGSAAAIMCGGSCRIVNAPVGLGYVFAVESVKAKVVRPLLKFALKVLLNPAESLVIFENNEDREELAKLGALRDRCVVIKGAGVDTQRFKVVSEPVGDERVVLLAARMIEEKGVRVFVEAARILRDKGKAYRFVVAGGVDHEHSSAIAEEELRDWHRQGIVDWVGERSDIDRLMAASHIFCLPTWHREGIPKVLLEAMASGRAVITTDVIGCRELVQHNKNGWLIPPRNVPALAEAIEYLAEHDRLRHCLAVNARKTIEREYTSEVICKKTLEVFRNVLVPARDRHD